MTSEYDRLKAQYDAIKSADKRKAFHEAIETLILKLRHGVETRGNEVAEDVLALLSDGVFEVGHGADPKEIAKTIWEIADPESLGPILCLLCHRKVSDCDCYKPQER